MVHHGLLRSTATIAIACLIASSIEHPAWTMTRTQRRAKETPKVLDHSQHLRLRNSIRLFTEIEASEPLKVTANHCNVAAVSLDFLARQQLVPAMSRMVCTLFGKPLGTLKSSPKAFASCQSCVHFELLYSMSIWRSDAFH